MTLLRRNTIVFFGCLWTLLGVVFAPLHAEQITHDFTSYGKEGSLIQTLTSTTAQTDLVHYTCHGNATFTSSGSSTVLRMTSSNDSLTTDQPIANWTQIQLEYSSAAPLTGSDIGIYIREPNTPWQEVSAGVQYRDFSFLATLPEKGTFYLLIRNKKDTRLDLRQIIYFITPCDCYQPE